MWYNCAKRNNQRWVVRVGWETEERGWGGAGGREERGWVWSGVEMGAERGGTAAVRKETTSLAHKR